jgi:hypothetical protein
MCNLVRHVFSDTLISQYLVLIFRLYLILSIRRKTNTSHAALLVCVSREIPGHFARIV